ncbi:hypothetical protein DPX16_12187 [Anabarilius grahami]|uniref:Uncharacterized protein n=1 Tax=Anabarilius grahami TaxID=495550 RepID=A0A3N0YRS3_ANAGA|nr:hypothetical protein DPX16_12187 [Anabarilius grahami]
MELREGPIQQNLQSQVGRNQQLSFEDVRKEALALALVPATPVFTQNIAVEQGSARGGTSTEGLSGDSIS